MNAMLSIISLFFLSGHRHSCKSRKIISSLNVDSGVCLIMCELREKKYAFCLVESMININRCFLQRFIAFGG